MPATTHSSHTLSRSAERQMRNWVLDLQTQQRLADERKRNRLQDFIHSFVAISRETGTDAGDLAHLIAEKCGWKALDGELLDYMAEHEHVSRLALEYVDERTVSWFHETFAKWLDKHLVSQAEYVSRMGKLVLLAAQHDSSVFVGRGVQFMLPRERGLIVRIIAPIKQRVQTIKEKRQCSDREATEFVEKRDHERQQFIRRYFQRDVADPHLYDLVINLANMPRDQAVALIVTEAKRREQLVLAEEWDRE